MSFNKPGNYNRELTASIGYAQEECDRCNTESMILSFNGSAGEYGLMNLCFPCIKEMFVSEGYVENEMD